MQKTKAKSTTIGMQRKVFTGIPGIFAAVSTVNPINIVELMIITEILETIVEKTTYTFNQSSCIITHFKGKKVRFINQNCIRLYAYIYCFTSVLWSC